MTLLGNTIVFLDTGFFKDYKHKDPTYIQLFKYAKEGGLVLCTSDICLEEWRTQKLSNIKNYFNTSDEKFNYLRKNCYLANTLLQEAYYPELRNYPILDDRLKNLVESFVVENVIKNYAPREGHIDPAWKGYFRGDPPFKRVKEREDIPDAWIIEGAKDAISDPAHLGLNNKFCITNDLKQPMQTALNNLGLHTISVGDLVALLYSDEMGVARYADTAAAEEVSLIPLESTLTTEDSPLEIFLSKTTTSGMREIYLKLVGYVIPLGTPRHEVLINAVVAKGFNRKYVEACAIMLSEEPHPYIKDTGSHYIVGNHEICSAASEVLLSEIIDMADDI